MDERLVLAVFVVAAVIAVVMVVLAVQSLLSWLKHKEAMEAEAHSHSDHDEDLLPLKDRLAGRFLPVAVRMFKPKDDDDMAGLRLKLAQAGFNTQKAVDRYLVIQVYCLLVGLGLALPWFFMDDTSFIFIGLSFSVLVGFLTPRVWLSMRKTKRETSVALALASTLDLLITCMEAGLGLEQAMERVAAELQFSEPVMADELKLTLSEMKAGISTSQAFRKLSQRVTLEEMHMLCSIIIQASTLGASIGKMLRQYAASWRNQRMMDLEEKAGKVASILTLPLTLCFLPSAMLAMLGPAVIALSRNLV